MAQALIAAEKAGKESSVGAGLGAAPKKVGTPNERNFVLSLIKHPGAPVLDVGTGDCAGIASLVATEGAPVVALDQRASTLEAARNYLKKEGLEETAQFLQADITASGLRSGSFENIVCFNVLHHVSRVQTALAELRRILAANGRLIISEYDENRDGFLDRLQEAVQRHFRSVRSYNRPAGRLVLTCEK